MTSGFLGIALHFIKSAFKNKNRKTPNTASPKGSAVRFIDEGPSGRVVYEGEEGSFSLYWEFGGGDVLVIISMPTPEKWEAQTKISLEKRLPLLNLIGSEAIRQKNGGRGRYEIQENCILIKS